MNDEIKLIENFGKLEIKEGDTIVLKTKYRLSNEEQRSIREGIEIYKKKIGIENLYCLILEKEMDIGVIQKNDS